MKINFCAMLLSLCCIPFCLFANWLSFRGENGNGMISQSLSPNIDLESKLSWRIDLPGRGLSSPIIVNNNVLITASSGPNQETLHILSFDIKNGDLLWERRFKATGRTICHEKTCVAAPTMVSDGKVVIAQFSSNDIFCLDLKGQLKWLRGLTFDYPNAANGLGMSSSPVISKEVLVVQVENDAESFATGLNLLNGTTIWQKKRPRGANWTSPSILGKGKSQLVALQSKEGITLIDPLTGKNQWSFMEGASTIPSSTILGKIILVPSNGITAVKGLPGGLSHTQLWQDNKLGPGTASPAISGSRFYVINKANVLTSADIQTGEIFWRMRLKGPMSGSPLATSNYLFIFNEDGLGQFVRLGKDKGETVKSLALNDTILCTPAVADKSLFIRSDKSLWRLSE